MLILLEPGIRSTGDYNHAVPDFEVITPAAPFCSQESIDHNESLVGTAPRADVWFLLEYHGRWGRKALAESDIPDPVKAHLNAQLDAIPESRLLLIKQPREENIRGVAFFIAVANTDPPTLYRFQLNDYGDLLSLDLAAIVARKPEFDENIAEEPVFVNCTNGLRDQCCALHGVATYWALQNEFPGKVWESTHHGGHRFAANLMQLPYGLSFGRLRKENAVQVMKAAMQGRIALDHLRGRTIYEDSIQAAEILLRKELGIDGVDDMRVNEERQLDGNRWRVTMNADGKVYVLIVEKQETGERIHVSCGDDKTSPVVQYEVTHIKAA